jgi:hypothetical protein
MVATMNLLTSCNSLEDYARAACLIMFTLLGITAGSFFLWLPTILSISWEVNLRDCADFGYCAMETHHENNQTYYTCENHAWPYTQEDSDAFYNNEKCHSYLVGARILFTMSCILTSLLLPLAGCVFLSMAGGQRFDVYTTLNGIIVCGVMYLVMFVTDIAFFGGLNAFKSACWMANVLPPVRFTRIFSFIFSMAAMGVTVYAMLRHKHECPGIGLIVLWIVLFIGTLTQLCISEVTVKHMTDRYDPAYGCSLGDDNGSIDVDEY